MIVHQVKQGEQAWLQVRAGVVTASELDRIVSPLGHIRRDKHGEWSDGAHTYICEKVSERWLGGPLQSFSGGVLEQGSILEDEAIPWLETHWKMTLGRPGFITTDAGDFGASPDAMLPAPGLSGVEIKCPQPANHVRWRLSGSCPVDHILQCQGGMYVTRSDLWYFVSYCRGFPKLVVEVARDDEIQDAIAEAVDACNLRIAEGYAALVAANGGKEPKRREPRPVPVRDDGGLDVSDIPDEPINFGGG